MSTHLTKLALCVKAHLQGLFGLKGLALAIFLLGFQPLASGEAPGSVSEIFGEQDPPNGSLIFQQRNGVEGKALVAATGSPYTHVGIIRVTGGGPYVMQSSADTEGVLEVSLEDFVSKGVGNKFAIYVVELGQPRRELNHPASLTAYDYYLRPYDNFYRDGLSALYSAELVYHAFRLAGQTIGRLERIGSLKFDTPEGRAFFLSDWKKRPECRLKGIQRDVCWSLIKRQRIVTPASLAGDPRVSLFMTTFDAD